MKPKKNPKADLRKKWVLFFQIGLILVLFLSLQAFQWKTYDPKPEISDKLQVDNLMEETPPVTIPPEKPLPPPPPPADVITEIPNDDEATEDDIAPTEVDLDDLVEPSDIEEPETLEEPEKLPFDVIEDVPVFPGCENLSENEERKVCMSEKINRIVSKEFNTRLGEELGLTGTNLVVIMFVVNKQGLIEQIQTRAPHPRLEEEAERVIGKLPKMRPGLQRGKPVPVSYVIPIRFKVQD